MSNDTVRDSAFEDNATDGRGGSQGQSQASSQTPLRISMQQACSFVGVGLETLSRFIESGYFPGASKETGILVTDLEAVFGVKIPTQFVRSSRAETIRSAAIRSAENDTKPMATDDETVEGPGNEASFTAAAQTATRDTETTNSETISSETTSSHQTPTDDSSNGASTQRPLNSRDESAADDAFSAVPRRSLIEMYERLVTQLQAENDSLRTERDWLKTRIERHEEKAARDQLLMMAETQTIRNLLVAKEQSSSPLRVTMQWLGLLPPPTPESPNK